jgi:hypothetical protein
MKTIPQENDGCLSRFFEFDVWEMNAKALRQKGILMMLLRSCKEMLLSQGEENATCMPFSSVCLLLWRNV